MPRREWTVVLLSDDDTGVRQFRVSRELVRLGIAFTLILVATLSSLGTAFLVKAGAGRANAQLVVKNEVLERELEQMRLQVDTLHLSLAHLSEKDQHYRLLAGLDPVDGDVRLAGIGGPDADSLQASPLYDVDPYTAERAYSTATDLNTLLRRARVLASSWSEAQDTLVGKQARLQATPSIFPTSGYVSSAFSTSRLHPLLHRPRPHNGIDIAAPTGTPVIAAAHGRVVSAGRKGEFGLLVEIDHGYGLRTRYAHLSGADVRPGQVVQRGQQIGAVGESGLAAGPHLHYEVLVNGRAANPRRYILDTNVIPD